MANSLVSEINMSDKDYYQIIPNKFQIYTCDNIKGIFISQFIRMNFKNLTKENWDAIDSNI